MCLRPGSFVANGILMATIQVDIPDTLKLAVCRYAVEHPDSRGRRRTIASVVAEALEKLTGWDDGLHAKAVAMNAEVARMDKEALGEETPAVEETPKPPLRGADW